MHIMFYHPEGFADGTMWVLYSSRTGKLLARIRGEAEFEFRDLSRFWTLQDCLAAVASGCWKMHVYD